MRLARQLDRSPFPEFTGARIVALADVVTANLDTTRAKFKVDATRAYYGPGAYRQVRFEGGRGSHETPPYYHPEHALRRSMPANTLLAKPVAVDVPGCQSI